jgi:hypothetical protein
MTWNNARLHEARQAAVPAPSPSALKSLTGRATWQALRTHNAEIGGQHLRELFAGDPEGGTRFVAQGAGLYFDCSKNRIDTDTIRLLAALALDCGLPQHVEAMFRGENINGQAVDGRLSHARPRTGRGASFHAGSE